MNQDRHKRKLSAILSADVVGYSRLMEEDRDWTIKNLEENKTLISDLVEEYKGRVVDAPGDNILAEFSSVTNAVECAVKIQQELKARYSKLMEEHRMEFRIGINLGEIVEEAGRIYGSCVNIAARIEGLSKSGGICISGRTYDHVKTEFDFGYEYLGEHNVKNISEPIRVYRVLTEPEASGKVIGEKKPTNNSSLGILMRVIITLIIILAGLFIWNFYSHQPSKKEPLKTIAVLPFDDLSPEKDQEHFVLGLSEEILNSISNISGLHVTSKTSSFAFRDTNKTIKEIAEILEREYILEGSVRKAGDSLRITAQLIKVADDSHIWSETYEQELTDIFDIQEDIAAKVAKKLKLTIESFHILGGTENIKAYEKYLNAKGLRSTNVTMTKQALEAIDAAIKLDPDFALAYAEKAHKHIILSAFGPLSGYVVEQDAVLEAAQRAIKLEPNLGDGYIYLGFIEAARKEWIKAEYNFRKALELIDESLSGDDDFIPIFYFTVGKLQRTQELLEKMRRNDPFNQVIASHYYFIYSLFGDIEQADEEYQNRNKLLLKGYSDWHDESITEVRLMSGDVLSLDDIVSSNPIHIKMKKYLDSPEHGLNELKQSYLRNDNLSHNDLAIIAYWVGYFGDPELSIELLGKMSVTSAMLGPYLWFPRSQEIRKLPQFKKFVEEIGLVDYWKEYGWPDLCRPIGDDDFECD